MGRLALATLRARLGSFVAGLVALCCAAALITACGTLLETGLLGSVATERYAASPFVVAADQSLHFIKANGKHKAKPLTEHAWLDAAVLTRLRRSPGTHAAVGELTFPASIVTPDGQVLEGPHDGSSWGHAWSSAGLTPFTIAAGRAPRAVDDVVVDADLAARAHLRVGAQTSVRTAAGTARYTVVGITDRSLADQAALFFTDATARRLAGHPDQFFAIGFTGADPPDEAQLHDAVTGTGARVASGRDRGAVEFTDVARTKVMLISVAGVLGATSLLVAALVVSGTFALSIAQRRRELALLRAIAATPRQLRRMIGREAVVIGVIAALPGCAAGLVVARWLRERFVAVGIIPRDLALHLSPVPAAGAFIVTTAAGWIAARLSARRTMRIHPSQALTEAAVEPSRPGALRTSIGLAAVGGDLVLLVVLSHLHTDAAARPVTLLCAVLAVLAVALLGPFIGRAAATALGPVLRVVAPRSGYLAAANNLANTARLASIITPLTLATCLAGTIVFTPTTSDHAAAEQRRDGVRADAVVVAPDPGVPADLRAAVAQVPGVRAVTSELRRTVRLGQDKYPADALTYAGLPQTLDLDVRRGSVAHLGPHDLALSTLAADHRGVAVGDRIAVTLGDGTNVRLTVAAIYARGLGFGDVVLPADLVLGHVDRPLADDVLVRGAEAASVRRALSGHPGVRVLGGDEFRAAVSTAQNTSTDVGYLAMSLVIAFAVIAVVNTLAMALGTRGPEFAALRLVGMKRRQVKTMVYLEIFAATTTALVLGAGCATAVLAAFARGSTPGYPPYAPLPFVGVIGGATVLVVAVATVLSIRVALRVDPATVIDA